MKKISKLFTIAALVLGLVTLFSCTKNFEDINKDPDNPGISQAAPDMLLTNSTEMLVDRVHEIFLGHEMGSCWVQHMAKVQYTDEDRYIFRPSVVNTSWRQFYAGPGECITTIYSIGNPNYKGVALTLKCYIGSVVTDLWGPVPYTTAWQGVGNLLPAYETQESIYRMMLAQLDSANTFYLDPAGDAIAGDILYGNDITLWKKFANSLRIRLLMRMSDRDPGFVSQELTKMINDPATYPIFESNADNASLAYLGSAPNNNPINENRKTRDDHRVAEHFINMLNSKYYDYRVMVFANPSSGTDEFVGMPNGLTSADAAAFNGGGLANTSKMGSFFVEATAPGQLLVYSELQFLLAEAAVKNYIPGGLAQAKVYYDAGITASFNQYRDYLQGIFDEYSDGAYGGLSIPAGYTVDDEIAYHVGDPTAPAYFDAAIISNEDALQKIGDQRYIAQFDQGLQAWFDWRRTGYPNDIVAPPASVNSGKVPIRVPYPSDEYATNPTALNEAVATLLGGADDLNTPVWWDMYPNK
jgi:hypothetical protein